MKFKYTALSDNNQKVEGILESDSLDLAKEELHKMELSIISIEKVSEEQFAAEQANAQKIKAARGITTFHFQATDPHGKPVEGTIEAQSDYVAYKRLVTEYQFKIQSLYPLGASEADIQANQQRLITELTHRLELEGLAAKAAPLKESDVPEPKIDENVIREIDKIIQTGKKVLTEHKAFFTPERLQEIERLLGELERIRTSNNMHHIEETCNNLFQAIKEPDNPELETLDTAAYQKTLHEISESKVLKANLSAYQKTVGFEKIKAIFQNIKRTLARLKKKPPPSESIESSLDLTKVVKTTGFKKVFYALKDYFRAPNKIAKQARKQELQKAFREWNPFRKKKKAPLEAPAGTGESAKASPPKSKPNFTPLFTEIDSFLCWLLFFYILYFFLVNFSLEKGIGLPSEFVIKTLRSPLMLNIALFLLTSHLLFRTKIRTFPQNVLGSLFLFFFGYGVYVLLIFNF